MYLFAKYGFRQLVLLIVVGAESSRSHCAPLAASRQPLVMPPKKQATAIVDHVDGVHYSLNLSSNMVCVGTGVVSNKDRDTFRQKTSADCLSLEEQIRARPKWPSIRAAAADQGIKEAVAAVAATAVSASTVPPRSTDTEMPAPPPLMPPPHLL